MNESMFVCIPLEIITSNDGECWLTFLLFQIKVDDDGKIVDAKFKTFGCGSAIASSSLASEWIKGKTVSCVLVMVRNVSMVLKTVFLAS